MKKYAKYMALAVTLALLPALTVPVTLTVSLRVVLVSTKSARL